MRWQMRRPSAGNDAVRTDRHLSVRVAVGEEELQVIRLRAEPKGLRHALGAPAVGSCECLRGGAAASSERDRSSADGECSGVSRCSAAAGKLLCDLRMANGTNALIRSSLTVSFPDLWLVHLAGSGQSGWH